MKPMNLREMTVECIELQDLLLDDEIDHADIERALARSKEQRGQKLKDCLHVAHNLDATLQAVGYEIKRLEAHKQRIERAGERLRDWVKSNLMPGEKFECEIGGFSVAKNPPAVVPDTPDTPAPDAYTRTEFVTTIDKKLILKDLQCGATIPGWSIKQGTHLRVK